MKRDIVLNMTYKTHIKNVRIFDHEKMWIEKKAKLLSHSIDQEMEQMASDMYLCPMGRRQNIIDVR